MGLGILDIIPPTYRRGGGHVRPIPPFTTPLTTAHLLLFGALFEVGVHLRSGHQTTVSLTTVNGVHPRGVFVARALSCTRVEVTDTDDVLFLATGANKGDYFTILISDGLIIKSILLGAL